jgi:hypothetical protein
MPDDPTPALLYRLNQNIMALGSAIEEIGIWIGQCSSARNGLTAHPFIVTALTLAPYGRGMVC